MRTMFLRLIVFAALASAARGDDDKWRRHYELGIAAVQSGDHSTAISEFSEAYALSHKPNLLYNIAKSYALVGEATHDVGATRLAIKYYRQYLAERSDAPDRDQVELIIGNLQELIDRAEHPLAAPPATVPPPLLHPVAPTPSASIDSVRDDRPGSRRRSGAGITLMIGGAVAGVAGGLLLILAPVVYNEGASQTTLDAYLDKHRSGSTMQIGGAIVAGVGAAALAAGLVLILLPRSTEPHALWLAPSTTGIAAGGVF